MGELKEKSVEILRDWASNDSVDTCTSTASERIDVKYVTLDGCKRYGGWWKGLMINWIWIYKIYRIIDH